MVPLRNLTEFGQNREAALSQVMDSPLDVRLKRKLGDLPLQFTRLSGFFRKRAAHLADSLGHLARVLGIQWDCLPSMVQGAIGNRGCDRAKGLRGNPRYLRNLEIGRAELVQVPDDAVGFGRLIFKYLGQKSIHFLQHSLNSFCSRKRRIA